MGNSASVEKSNGRRKATLLTLSPHKRDVASQTNGIEESLAKENRAQIDEKEHSNMEVTDEVGIEIDRIFKALTTAIDRIKTKKEANEFRAENGDWNGDLLMSLGDFYETYANLMSIDSLQYDVIQQCQCKAGKMLSESKSISVMCKVIMNCWRKGYKNKIGEVDEHQHEGISMALINLLNYSDCSIEVACDIANEKDFLETINIILTTILAAHMHKETKDEDVIVMSRCLSIYVNLSRVNKIISRLRSVEAVSILSFYLHAKDDVLRLFALSCLANIINEKESAILQNNPDVIELLLMTLSIALKDLHHKCQYSTFIFSALECTMTVRRLGKNDANKILLVELGCLPHLVELVRIGNEAEQREAVGAIRVLAFEPKNHSKIMELLIVDLLEELKKQSHDKEILDAVEGTLWELREMLQNIAKYKHIVDDFDQKKKNASATNRLRDNHGAPVTDKKGHIMISYNWSHKKKITEIKDFLKNQGHDIWIDIEGMAGSVIESMSKAVEDAHVVLICMSREYKNSDPCREEATYAHKKKKNIIPLKMEQGYDPDGWLGFIVGEKLYFEFSGKYPFEEKAQELHRAIAQLYGNVDLEPKVTPNTTYHKTAMTSVEDVRNWTPGHVHKWIEKHNLPKEHFDKLTGEELALLLIMKSEAPESFYNSLQKDLGITNMQTKAKFVSGLCDLSI